MNFLAHLHVATQCQSQLMGNLLADFVRGKPDGRFSQDTVEGVYLHRYVDSYIDSLDAIKTCRALFPAHLYRYSAIALDIFWDHALATQWSTFHSTTFAQFLLDAEHESRAAVAREPFPLPEHFLFMHDKMWKEQWLPSYKDIDTLPFVLKRMSLRSPRMGPLADTAAVVINHRDTLLAHFPSIYSEVLHAASTFATQQKEKRP
ncbi:ACP phosphodiesterase [Enterovibrio sp. ZSDZ35]|uniref:ACP phosphodiesterase n=1 Tax=Enterovibrio qingdaonensis TaxID=2899818 RepID=A0ABT5QT98_9GAMM|nr:ACP phosphodiesterase [Enterovibrio sp. ZSDZ35]MDD1784206.1 ACP phosphodiesterase [Enterovibrio sp. ZSDZ35]